MQKTRTKLIFTLALAFLTALTFGLVSALQNVGAAEAETSYGYYYDQLESTEAKAVYKALADMRDDGALQTGTETWDLVEKGYLSNKEYDQTTLTAAFGAGKDAFMLDNADLFYIDFDLISLRSLTDGKNYKITLGIGREDTYLADGFTTATVSDAIEAFDEKVDEIVTAASAKSSLYDKILCAYDAVMDSAIYALEFDAGEEYADYVRCAYGVLVMGKGVCQSFSQALKTVLDKLDITSVVVEGTFIDNDGNEQSHMWLHVMMDDNRWYVLDATMDNALRDDGYSSTEYFLMNGSDAAGLYVPNGVISTSGFEFDYPSLSMADYETPSSSFVIETATTASGSEYEKISYNGMGLRKAEEAGYYILATYSVNTETGWFYVIWQLKVALANSGGDIDDYDFDDYFNGQSLAGADYILAVTTDPYGDDASVLNFSYSGDNIFDKSSAVLSDTDERPPYAVTVSPDSLRFYIGSSYNVTITYNDDLKIADSSAEVGITFTVPDGVTLSNADGVITNVKWSADNPSQISFTFTPDKNYSADRCGYTFTLVNLVGEKSGKAPVDVILTALYKPSFSCPLNPLSYCTAVATVPALISDSDLSTEGWEYTDSNGETQTVSSSSLGAKISLVATTYNDEQNAEYESAIDEYNKTAGNDATILKSATYDLSLNLCDVQMNYLNGNKVMIMVPFPDGYSANDAGVSFKAYHFADNGTVEEIECYCTEYGIILFCSSFSAYTVAAVEGESGSAKAVLVTSEGNGSVGGTNLVTVEEGDTLTLKFTADDGYCVDSVTINGKVYTANGEAEYSLERAYAELDQSTTIIVKFASASVVKSELDAGYALTIDSDGGNVVWLIVAICLIAAVVLCVVAAAIVLIVKNRKK